MRKFLDKLHFFKNNKIITPTPKQVAKNAGVVAACTLLMGAFVWTTDAAAYGLLDLVLSWFS